MIALLKEILEHIKRQSNIVLLHLRGMFEKNCLFLSGDFKFQVSPKLLIPCHQRPLRGYKCKASIDVSTIEGVTVR